MVDPKCDTIESNQSVTASFSVNDHGINTSKMSKNGLIERKLKRVFII